MNIFLKKHIVNTVYKSRISVACYIIVNMILSLSLIFSNIIYFSFSNYISDLIKLKRESRSLIALYDDSKPDLELLKQELLNSNSHIEAVITQDARQAGGVVEELITDSTDGAILTKGYDINNLPISAEKMQNYDSDNWCIIPERLYPDSGITGKIDTEKYIDGKTLVGKTITLISDVNHFDGKKVYAIDHKKFFLKVIGTYESSDTLDLPNVCYTSFGFNENVNSTINDSSINQNHNPPLIIIIDNENNVNDVINSIDHSKYRLSLVDNYNKDAPFLIKTVVYSVCIALYSFSIILSFALLISMIKKSKNEISLMKAVGYTDETIRNIFLHGYILLDVVGFILGLFCYVILFFYFKKIVIETNCSYVNMRIISTPLHYIIPFILLLTIPMILLLPIYTKIKKISPMELWVDED